MIIDYWLLSVSLLLLWLPRHGLRMGQSAGRGRKETRGRSTRNKTPRTERAFQESSSRMREALAKPRNWVDFLRAAVGGVAVVMVCFHPSASVTLAAGHRMVFISQCVVLVIAVVVQTVRYEGRITLFAPVFFVMGLSFGLIGWPAALFAFITVWILDLVFSSWGLMLLSHAAFVMIYGLLLPHRSFAQVCLAAGLSLLPVLLSAMTKQPLTQLNKKTKSKRG